LMHSERIKLSKKLHHQLTAISNLVHKFEFILNGMDSNKQVGALDEMDSIAEMMEDKLMRFKSNHQEQLKELENAEQILGTELSTTINRLDSFSKSISEVMAEESDSTPKFAKQRKLSRKWSGRFGAEGADSRPPKLIEIQRQIDEHGRYGGWPQRDHDDFLKLYSQIATDRELLHRLSEVMPQYTLSELREHLSWFDHHERLWEHKRQLVAEWKAQRLKERESKQSKVAATMKAADRERERKKQARLQREREEKRRRIEEWREQKEQEEDQRNRAKEEAMRKRQSKQRRLHRERVREQKRLLLDMAERKKLKEMVQRTAEPSRTRKAIRNSERNKKLLIKFQTKDMLLVSKKREAVGRKEQEERDREWRMVNLIAKSQPHLHVKSDKQRLLQMTAAANTRAELNSRSREKPKSARSGRSMGYQAPASKLVPSWRRGL